MDKQTLVEALKKEIRSQYERSLAALAGAEEAATGDDTKAEGKYDTRGLEASYLAAGQAEQADELARGIAAIDAFTFEEFDIDDPIALGALIEGDSDGELVYYLLAPAGGGLQLTSDDGELVTVLGPGSPLRNKLIGKTTGFILDEPSLMILEVI